MPVPQPSAWTRSASCWFCASLSLPAEATLRILPRSGRIAWVARLRACFAEPPELAHRALARDVLFRPAAKALFGALGNEIEQLVGLQRVAGEPVIERVLDRLLDDLLRFRGGEAILGLALEF